MPEVKDQDPEVEVVEDVVPEDGQDPSGIYETTYALRGSELKPANEEETGENPNIEAETGASDYFDADEEEAMANNKAAAAYPATVEKEKPVVVEEETVAEAAAVGGKAAAVGGKAATDEEKKPEQEETYPKDGSDLERQTPHNSVDKCFGCTCCGCPNGAMQIIFAQFFLWCGLMMCSWSLVDCKFIEATAGYPERYIPNDEISSWRPEVDFRRGFGFIFNETVIFHEQQTVSDGCAYFSDDRYWVGEEFENYQDFLGDGWAAPLALSGTSLSMGWLLFLGTFTFWCCSYIRAIRWVVATAMILVMTGFQCSSFAVLGSGFCDAEGVNCKPSRGFWIGVGGVCCYFLSAVFFFIMKDYPGRA